MSTPEDIPEDRAPSYPCERANCNGNIGQIDNEWQCDKCDWDPSDPKCDAPDNEGDVA